MKIKFVLLLFIASVTFLINCKSRAPIRHVRKPVVYIYPEQKQKVTVKLDFNGTLRATYPLYKNQWEFMADVDGSLTDLTTNEEYQYLFYDGVSNYAYEPISEGFAVKTDTVIAFLKHKLSFLGLNSKEQNDMISFWLPELNEKQFSLIRFRLNDNCNVISSLTISPKPETEIRVMLEFLPIDEFISIPEQKLQKNYRKGFTVVEWGGVNLSDENESE